jgi:hypothetical protein
MKGVVEFLEHTCRLGAAANDAAAVSAATTTLLAGGTAAGVAAGAGLLPAVLVLGAAGFGVYSQYKSAKQLETIQAFLGRLVHEQGSLARAMEHVAQQRPEMLDGLPEELRGDPWARATALFQAIESGNKANLEEILRQNNGIAAALADHARAHAGQFAQLAGLLNEVRRISESTEKQLAEGRRPRLRWPVLPRSEGSRFVYGQMRTGFHGRDAERARLDAFLAHEDRFRWWLVTGSAGMGKSRLALDLLFRHQDGWDAGFFVGEQKFNAWDRWTPELPTLIVFDYVARADTADAVRDAIRALADRPPTHKVRLLLLERRAEGRWWDSIRGLGSGSARDAAERTSHGPPLELPPLGDDAIEATVRATLADRGRTLPEDGIARILTACREIDPRRTPLMASMAAEVNAELRPDWSREDLLTRILERESARWTDNGLFEGDDDRARGLNLLALATMCRGLRLAARADEADIFDDPAFERLIPRTPDRGIAAVRAMTGEGGPEGLAPWEPDLLGELFVLGRLGGMRGADSHTLRLGAWRWAPLGHALFVLHTAQNFPAHRALDQLFEAPR